MAANNIYGRVGLWVGVGDAHPTKAAQEAANEVEELGFTTMWIPEAVGRDVFVSSTNYLAATKTLKIATGIANIYARDPMTTNSATRTLAEAYPDRFSLDSA
jgi:alkanesulfonate monooxygenase SsuD/methylene tetrahydromethanopterin reductase-like flavin-dependent oxidoreductase (luciferase family)